MTNDINSMPYDEATLTKLDIFERYLENWLPVFLNSKHDIAIWDFFAGSGKDSKDVLGSPMRILRQIEKFSEQIKQHYKPIRIVLNEAIKEKADKLAFHVESDRQKWSLGGLVNVECHNEDFQDIFRNRYEELKRQPNLIFLDQYGIKHVTGEVFQMLIKLERTDFLFFISSSFMKRFVDTPEFSAIFPNLSSTDIVQARIKDIHRLMRDHYQKMVPADNTTRLYPFSLKKGTSNGNIYGLVFGSRHPLGVEKFLDIAWKQNALNGEANFDIDNDMEAMYQPQLFQEYRPIPKRERFELSLKKFISDSRETTNREIYEFTMNMGHPKAHARECVIGLRKEKKIDCDGRMGLSYKSCFGEDAKESKVTWLARR